jgi:predicted small lipoprotein YifL
MPKLRYLLVVLAIVGLAGCKHKAPGYCPHGMADVPLRSEPGKSVWCESADKARAQWIEWHPKTTRPRQSCSYFNGRPEGSFTAWYPDGKPWVQGQFADGQKVGKWKQWDNVGSEVAEGDYRGGRLIAGAPVAGMAGCERAARP